MQYSQFHLLMVGSVGLHGWVLGYMVGSVELHNENVGLHGMLFSYVLGVLYDY